MPVVLLSLLALVARVECHDDATAATVRSLWSPFLLTGAAAVDTTYVVGPEGLQRDGASLLAGASPQAVLGRLAQDLNERALTRPGVPFAVHAGCVTDGTRTVAWPAASTVGKSTFTAACIEAGWSYVTDEGVVLADGATVTPYPRPLGLSGVAQDRYRTPASRDVEHELLVPPGDLRAVDVDDRPVLTDLLLLERRAGTEGLELRALPRVEAVPVLLRRSFNAFRDQPAAVARVTALAAGLRVWRAAYRDAWDAAPLLRDALTREQATSG